MAVAAHTHTLYMAIYKPCKAYHVCTVKTYLGIIINSP